MKLRLLKRRKKGFNLKGTKDLKKAIDDGKVDPLVYLGLMYGSNRGIRKTRKKL